MAYRLRRDEAVASGLERIVNTELRSAVKQLGSEEQSEEAIHEARKSIKKVRAVLELIGDEIGADRDVKRLRRAGRLLSPLRDAAAMVASTDEFCDHRRRHLTDETCSAIRDLLNRHKERVARSAVRDRPEHTAAKLLKIVRRSAKGWTTKNAGYPVLVPAIQRSYKEARQAMAEAGDRHRADDFHSWRKRVKALWYALRLLERRVPRLRRELADLERLETWLGEDHNLLTLRAQVAASQRISRNRRARARVTALAKRRQEELRRLALSIGALIFKHKPKRFVRDLRLVWQHRDRGRPDRRRLTSRVRSAIVRR